MAPKNQLSRIDPFWGILGAVFVAGMIAWLVIETVGMPSHPIQPGYRSVLSYVIAEVGLALGGWLASFALLGTIMRAGAHKLGGKDRGRDGLDFVGKLFAVAAASLAFWVAVLAIPDLPNWLGRTTVFLVPTLAVLLLLLARKWLWGLCKRLFAAVVKR